MSSRFLRLTLYTLIGTLLCCGDTASLAGDWPQILGPHRNGAADGEALLESWPKSGPQTLWSKQVGMGFAGVAVADGVVIVFHREDDVERVEALEASSGKPLWKADFEADYTPGINPDRGPRCVPLIDKSRDRVFVFGAAGALHCVSLSKGEKIWSRDAKADYRAEDGYFGAGCCPIILGENLLVNIGGFREDAGIVAFSVDTGKTVWKATDEHASYSSPVAANFGGRDYAIFVTGRNTVCIDAKDGVVRFQFPFGRSGPTVNAAVPLLIDDNLFVTASYRIGAKMLQIDGAKTKSLWASDEVMSCQYTTCVHRDGYLYGTDGREDIGTGSLRCIEANSGKVQWSVDRFGLGHIILADDKLLICGVDGKLTLAAASPKGYQELASSEIFQKKSRAIPALSDGRLFIRSTSGEFGELKCFLVGKASR